VPTRLDTVEASRETADARGETYEAPAATPTRRVLEPVEIPPQRGLSGATIAGIALVVGVAAIALGLWAFVTSVRAQETVFVPRAVPNTPADRAIALLANPSTRRLPLDGSRGRVVLAVGRGGRALLVVDGIAPAAAGHSYEAWVLRPRAKAPAPAAVFSGKENVVPLAIPVRQGSIVAVSVERAGGAAAPTRTPLFVTQLV
jgi:hypothetical protein